MERKIGKLSQIELQGNEELLKYDATDCLNATRIFLSKFSVFPNILGLNPSEELRMGNKGRSFIFNIEDTIDGLLSHGYDIQVNRVEDIDEHGVKYNKRFMVIIPEIQGLIFSREEIITDSTNTEHTSDFHEIYYSDYSLIEPVVKLIWEKSYTLIDESTETNLFAIKEMRYGYVLIPKVFNKTTIDIKSNYNDDFEKADESISKFLKEKDDHGLVILNGTMGTGKTYYIRHLITNNPDVNFILCTRTIAEFIAEPSFIDFLSRNPNSVLILEDCENVVQNRNVNQGNGITNLLNIGDGLLSDSLKIKLLLTFNTDLRNIDSALQRKGRLKYQYSFGPLTFEKTKKMFSKLGKEVPSNLKSGLTLAEIYNYEEDNNANSGRKQISL